MSDPPSPGSEAAAPSSSAVFYKYRDASGRTAIVDSLSRVPATSRSSAERIDVGERIAVGEPRLAIEQLAGTQPHWPSFLAGAASMLVVGLLLLGLRKTGGRLLRVGIVLALGALGSGLYLGWAHRMAGRDTALLASPAALVDDARAAVDQLNARAREQERVLREIEKEGR